MKKIRRSFLALAFVLAMLSTSLFAHYAQISSTVDAPLATAQFVQNIEDDVFGYFFISGKVPKAFADIDHINLGGSGEYGAQANPPFYGQIRLKDRKRTDFKLLKPVLEGRNLSFKTETVRGVSYSFSGVLTTTDFGSDQQPAADEKVLSGTLKKMKAGKVIAESKLEFTWLLGD